MKNTSKELAEMLKLAEKNYSATEDYFNYYMDLVNRYCDAIVNESKK